MANQRSVRYGTDNCNDSEVSKKALRQQVSQETRWKYPYNGPINVSMPKIGQIGGMNHYASNFYNAALVES